ncbi:MAG TPA: CotH kinase family protein, partial [Candidatus Saccharimonadales bacterium]|nr:CotH kinase family protein [Candidatus Saccharimonadales bacterium]
YDGLPPWRGAIEPKSADPKRSTVFEFDTNIINRVQAYHLLGKAKSVENATWNEQSGGKDYKYTGTLVFEGRVYDHIRFRARGGVWRYAMGKNMWKFDFNKGHPLLARDDYGRAYPVPWSKANLRACIDQGDYGMRGNQGMFEAVGFRLFNLCGVESPRTHWVQLRIIDGAEENPKNQYAGDFWGLYLAIENEDGHFLKAHDLPDGNLYKMEGGTGTLQSHAPDAVTNKSDLVNFMNNYRAANPTESWWRTNFDLPRYYSYRSILECIHHYDVDQGPGKNYGYFLNPRNGRWQVIPWDIDLSWADHMYGGGDEPFRSRVLVRPAFRLEYRNRLREIRDLLYNTDQACQLIDECAAIIGDPAGGRSFVDADRARWDYHPVMAIGGKAGQGRFYEAAPTRDFRGMVQLMKNYVKTRGAWVDTALLRDTKIPETPTITYTGNADFPAKQLTFRTSDYRGTNHFAAMKWRLAEVTPAKVITLATSPRHYEITPLWESEELTTFASTMTFPIDVAQPGHTCRARVRVKDASGRWSHWSAPIEFSPK